MIRIYVIKLTGGTEQHHLFLSCHIFNDFRPDNRIKLQKNFKPLQIRNILRNAVKRKSSSFRFIWGEDSRKI